MVNNKRRILVTRPLGQEVDLKEQLIAQGYDVVHQPLLKIEPEPEMSVSQRQVLQALDTFSHVIFVSANAVRVGCDWIESYWPQYPVGLHWYGPGSTSAALLQQRGLSPLWPRQQYDSEGLLALPSLQAISGDKVLLVKGAGGRTLLRETCIERGAKVTELVCYKRTLVNASSANLRCMLDQVDAVALSSGSACEQFGRVLENADCRCARALPLVVPGENAAQRAKQAGFSTIFTAASAVDSDVVAAINKIWV